MCSKNNESKQQVTLQIMECEPFLPLSEEIGSQLSRDDSGAVVKGVHAETHDPGVHPQDVCVTASQVLQALQCPQ